MHAAMRLDSPDQLSSNRRPVMDDEGVSRAQDGPARRREQRVPSAVARREGQIVERRAVGLDNDPVLH